MRELRKMRHNGHQKPDDWIQRGSGRSRRPMLSWLRGLWWNLRDSVFGISGGDWEIWATGSLATLLSKWMGTVGGTWGNKRNIDWDLRKTLNMKKRLEKGIDEMLMEIWGTDERLRDLRNIGELDERFDGDLRQLMRGWGTLETFVNWMRDLRDLKHTWICHLTDTLELLLCTQLCFFWTESLEV